MRSSEWMTHDKFREKLVKEESGRQSRVEIPKCWIACIVSSGLKQREPHSRVSRASVNSDLKPGNRMCWQPHPWEDTELVLLKFRVWKEMDGAWGLELGSSLGAVWSLTGGQCWGWPRLWAVWSLIISTQNKVIMYAVWTGTSEVMLTVDEPWGLGSTVPSSCTYQFDHILTLGCLVKFQSTHCWRCEVEDQ